MLSVPYIGKEKEDVKKSLVEEIQSGIIQRPSVVRDVFGNGDDSVIRPYYAAQSFMHGLKMRNGDPSFLHVVMAGIMPELYEKESGYILEAPLKIDLLFHEFGEDVGKYLIGAFLMFEFVNGHYKNQTYSVNLMSNSRGMAVSPVQENLENIAKKSENKINPQTDEDIQRLYELCSDPSLEVIESYFNEIDFSEKSIRGHYREIMSRPMDFLRDLKNDEKSKLSVQEKSIINDYVRYDQKNFLEIFRSLDIKKLEDFLKGKYFEVFDLIKHRKYTHVDPLLTARGEPLYTATLEKTFYHNYLWDMKNHALQKIKEKLSKGKEIVNDEDLSLLIEKLSDLIATVSILEVTNEEHMLHQFRKASRSIHISEEAIKDLKELGISKSVYNDKMNPITLYLLKTLEERINYNLKNIRKLSESEIRFSIFQIPLEYMAKEKIPELKDLLKVKKRWGRAKIML